MGKKMHRLLYKHPSADPRTEMLQRFEEECEMLSHAERWRGMHMYVDSTECWRARIQKYLTVDVTEDSLLTFRQLHAVTLAESLAP